MSLKKQISKLPDAPGIYLFYDTKNELIYVGKATSLKNRVRSYWSGKTTPRPIELMLHKVESVKYKETDSVLEAIILEANYIKDYVPRYNVLGKDDKSWNYIVITKEDYPRVATMRQHEFKSLNHKNIKSKKQFSHVFGPYPGLNTKAAMKLLRQMFYFSDCVKLRNKETKKNKKIKPCFYYQLGQCLGVCTKEISSTEYKQKVIRPLTTFLGGRKNQLIKTLQRRMKLASKEQNYEEAGRLRNQIASLQKIHDVTLLNKSFITEQFEENYKIEGYDISNLGSTNVVGSLVVFVNGEADKQQYRKFKIKTFKGQSDVDALDEVLTRRLKHSTKESQNSEIKTPNYFWPLPDVFMVDGGKPQVNRAKKVLRENNVKRPVVGIAKGPDRKKNEIVLGSNDRKFVRWVYQNTKTLIRVRDEAHRFAIKYQRETRKLTY